MSRAMVFLCVMSLGACVAAAAPNYSITPEPYLTGDLFTNPLLPCVGQEISIIIRAVCDGGAQQKPSARIAILDAAGETVFEKQLELTPSPAVQNDDQKRDAPPSVPSAEASVMWKCDHNGLFTVRAGIDPENAVAESCESDNEAELVLPVVVTGKGRKLHFPWYRESACARWCTCITSAEKAQRLLERGIMPLAWEYGGMSWTNYDKELAKTDPEAVLAEFERLFYERYSSTADVCGFGIDEVGGYPESFALRASVASVKALARAKANMPSRFFAVWNGGSLRPEIAAYCRQGADLLILETYLWRALPDELGSQDIYAALESRVEPYVRAMDMFQPAYANHCYTLFGLDTSERPDRTDVGELEQVIRFIRHKFPEMRGVGWYNGGYGSYGLTRTEATDQHHEAVQEKADQLCFEYWIKPCVTLMEKSLWISQKPDGGKSLVLAVSNIGSVDSGSVTVELFADGAPVGAQWIDHVPAGAGRNENTVQIRQPIDVVGGSHTFKAIITSAPGSTVLDDVVELTRYVP